jgi:hypothetical protein
VPVCTLIVNLSGKTFADLWGQYVLEDEKASASVPDMNRNAPQESKREAQAVLVRGGGGAPGGGVGGAGGGGGVGGGVGVGAQAQPQAPAGQAPAVNTQARVSSYGTGIPIS